MKLDTINSCCTAKMLCGFRLDQLGYREGVGPAGNYEGDEIGDTKEQVLAKLLELKFAGQAMVTAFTNDKQVKANALLKEIGFKSTKWATKTQHENTRLKLWWFALDQLEA